MISGICSVCGKAGPLQTCRLCGRQVCAEHFKHAESVCISCKGRISIE